MAFYAYKCKNEKCKEYNVEKSVSMQMSEYSEEKLPKCSDCEESTIRVFSPSGIKTNDGFKS